MAQLDLTYLMVMPSITIKTIITIITIILMVMPIIAHNEVQYGTDVVAVSVVKVKK